MKQSEVRYALGEPSETINNRDVWYSVADPVASWRLIARYENGSLIQGAWIHRSEGIRYSLFDVNG